MTTVLALDLGTSGCKASLFEQDGVALAECFVPYETRHPRAGWHEQRPVDWWNAVVTSVQKLGAEASEGVRRLAVCALSGQSLALVPVDAEGELLSSTVSRSGPTHARRSRHAASSPRCQSRSGI